MTVALHAIWQATGAELLPSLAQQVDFQGKQWSSGMSPHMSVRSGSPCTKTSRPMRSCSSLEYLMYSLMTFS